MCRVVYSASSARVDVVRCILESGHDGRVLRPATCIVYHTTRLRSEDKGYSREATVLVAVPLSTGSSETRSAETFVMEACGVLPLVEWGTTGRFMV